MYVAMIEKKISVWVLGCNVTYHGRWIGKVYCIFITSSGKSKEKLFSNWKKGSSVILAVKKFHQYIFGRSFKVISDHNFLLGLFGEHKRIHSWLLLVHKDLSSCILMQLRISFSSRSETWKCRVHKQMAISKWW